jgi:hypothetical protein
MNISNFWELLLSVLFLPVLNNIIEFAWGSADPYWLMSIKRVFLLLPALALIVGYWTTIVSFLTVIIREKRKEFLATIFVTWWDLGRSIFAFWAGIPKSVLSLATTLFSFARLMIVGLWVLIQDLVLIPFRVLGNLAQSMLNPGVPWIAVGLTLFWCFFEAAIFTHVMMSLVIDTLSNMTGNQLSENFIRVPLFVFMLFIILGSYAVLSTWTEAIRSRKVGAIFKITTIELVAMFVEVVFLYREFVDALVPWFAQHSAGQFDLGVFGTLAIASMTWFGIRSLSWFLFASSGTPTIMAIIQGTGLELKKSSNVTPLKNSFYFTVNLVSQIKQDTDWVSNRGDDLVAAFLLPPLQILAAGINFCMVLFSTQHLFELPFKSFNDIKDARALMSRFDSSRDSSRKNAS